MRTLRRLFAVAFGVAGAVGTLICIAGIIGCWLFHAEAVQRADRVFGRAESSLGEVRGNSAAVVERLDRTRLELAAFREREASFASQPPDERGMRRALSRKAVQSASPDLNDARNKLRKATEAALVVNGFLDVLAVVSTDNRVGVDTAQLRESSERLTELIAQAEKLSIALARVSPDATATEEATESSRIDEALEKAIALVQTGTNGMDEAHKRVEQWRANIQRWVTIAAVACTLALIWIGAGQISLFLHARAAVRRQ